MITHSWLWRVPHCDCPILGTTAHYIYNILYSVLYTCNVILLIFTICINYCPPPHPPHRAVRLHSIQVAVAGLGGLRDSWQENCIMIFWYLFFAVEKEDVPSNQDVQSPDFLLALLGSWFLPVHCTGAQYDIRSLVGTLFWVMVQFKRFVRSNIYNCISTNFGNFHHHTYSRIPNKCYMMSVKFNLGPNILRSSSGNL